MITTAAYALHYGAYVVICIISNSNWTTFVQATVPLIVF